MKMILLAISANSDLWKLISSREAISVYLAVLMVLVGVLVVVVLTAAARTNSNIDRLGDRSQRFSALCQIDHEKKKENAVSYNNSLDLAQICENFRDFAASRLGLYYELEDIRSFIAGIGVSKLVIMQGLSGTGKTSLATAFGEYLRNKSTVISVQPMWKERSDMIGYFNEFTKRFSEGTLLKTLYAARYNDEVNVVVLDEMNIARVEYYFADFLSQLELNPSNRYLDIVSDSWPDDPELFENGRFLLPENVWFIGTANNDDSTFAISDKVYDRAMIMNLDKKADPFIATERDGDKISYRHICGLYKNAIDTYTLDSALLEKMGQVDRYLAEELHIGYGNRIKKQLLEYVPIYKACGGNEVDAMDDFYTKKIMRKLEGLSPSVLRYAVDGIMAIVNKEFAPEEMKKLRELLDNKKKSVM